MLKSCEKNFANVYVVYAFVIIYYQIMHLVAPINVWTEAHIGWLSPILALLGFGLLLLDAATKRDFWDKKYAVILIVLLAVMCLSSVSYIREGGIIDNAKVIIWQAVQMLVLFPLSKGMTWDKIRRFFKFLYVSVSVVWIPAMLVSFCQFAYAVSYNIYTDTGVMRQGFGEGRLFGIFTAIYFATVLTVLLMCMSLYYMLTAEKLIVRIWTAIEAILCLVYVVLSGTRTAMLAMMASVFVCLGLFLHSVLKGKKLADIGNICMSIVGAACVSILLLLVCQVTDAGLKRIPLVVVPHIQHTLAENGTLGGPHKIGLHLAYLFDSTISEKSISIGESVDESTEEPEKEQIQEPISEIDDVQMEREDVQKSNISNNRFSIWKDYMSAVIDGIHPMLLGYTPGNYMKIIRESFPDLYIVSYIRETHPEMYERDLIYDTHCTYISVLVTTGLIGSLVMLSFLVRSMIAVLRYAKEKRSYDFYFLFAAVLMILAAAGLDSDLFFKCTDTSMLFWLLAGILLKRVGVFSEQKSE